jgi:hypothetical protein
LINARYSKPPMSPCSGLLRGMERSGRDVGGRGSLMVSPGAVGVAF